MNEDQKMVISAKGYTEAVKQMQDLSHHIKAVYYNQCIAEEYKLPWLTLYHLQSDIQVNDEIREKLMEGEYDNCSIESFVSALIELQNTLHEDENVSH